MELVLVTRPRYPRLVRVEARVGERVVDFLWTEAGDDEKARAMLIEQMTHRGLLPSDERPELLT